jgi:hypothetical protein
VTTAAAPLRTNSAPLFPRSKAPLATSTLPARGVVPAVFFGLALFFATAYMAWLSREKRKSIRSYEPHTSLPIVQERRLDAFVDWVTQLAMDRALMLRGAVVSFGYGVLTLPLPFVQIDDLIGFLILGTGVVGVLSTLWFSAASYRAQTGGAGPAAGGSGRAGRRGAR